MVVSSRAHLVTFDRQDVKYSVKTGSSFDALVAGCVSLSSVYKVFVSRCFAVFIETHFKPNTFHLFPISYQMCCFLIQTKSKLYK